MLCVFFFFQAEDGIRDLVRSRGLGDVYKRQVINSAEYGFPQRRRRVFIIGYKKGTKLYEKASKAIASDWLTKDGCLLYTSDAADERSSVDLGGRRIIKKKK